MPVIPGFVIATVAAGPLFVTSHAAADTYLRLPRPIVLDPTELAMWPMLLLPATLFGTILAVVPNALGTAALRALGDVFPAWRKPVLWFLTGAAIGLGLATLTGAVESPAVTFALVATSALCASICRVDVEWD